MNRLTDRRRGVSVGGGQQSDVYEGCVILEFTEETDNNVRRITADNNNAVTFLDYIIIDGVEITPTRNYQHIFSKGTHKIGWKLNTTVVYANIFTSTSDYNGGKFTADQALMTIPEQITEIISMAMRGMPAYHPMRGVICYAKTPPIAETLSIANWYINPVNPLKVPADSVKDYKAAPGWSQYANNINNIIAIT